MPGYKTHVLGGILLGLSLLILFRALGIVAPYQLPELFCALLCGSLFPDIDTRSMGRRLATLIFLLLAVVAAALGYLWTLYAILGLLCFARIQPHRGITHRIFPLVLFCMGTLSAVAVLCPGYLSRGAHVVLFFALGAISHLILDGRLFHIRRRRRR